MSKRMKHSKTVKIRFTNPEYQAVKITACKKGYSVPELLRVLCTIAGAESDPLLNPGTIKIIQNPTLCQIWNYIQFWEIPEDVKQEIRREITRYV